MKEWILIFSVAFFGYKMIATPARRWLVAYWVSAFLLISILIAR